MKYFSGNPLVQYLDQQNPLSELSHRRRITSFGPGGIDPNAAGKEMRVFTRRKSVAFAWLNLLKVRTAYYRWLHGDLLPHRRRRFG